MKPFSPPVLRQFVLGLLASLFLLPAPAFAQTPHAPTADDYPPYVAEAQKAIDIILATPEFDQTRTIKELKAKKPETGNGSKFIEWLLDRLNSKDKSDKRDTSLAAMSGEIILWLLAFGLLVFLAVHSKHWLPFLGWRRATARPARNPALQSGSALEPVEALPEEIATVAERCWREGRKAEALSLLYRGMIELLATRHRLELPQGATEEEMQQFAGRAMPSCKDDFEQIARAWLSLAYAHRPPADFNDLLAGFGRLQQTRETAL